MDSHPEAILPAEGKVFVADGMNLMALDQEDGSLVWETPMTDQLNYSEDCLAYVDGVVVALTLDRYVQAFDASTGDPLWERSMEGYSRELFVMGDSLVILDYTVGASDFSFYYLDPRDGTTRQVITPVCSTDPSSDRVFDHEYLDDDEGILFEPTGESLYLVYGSYFGCVQRYSLPSGDLLWQTITEDYFNISHEGFFPLLIEGMLYFGEENRLLGVDTKTGELTTLLEQEDREFVPLALVDETLIVRVMRTRGSQTFELLGVDPQTGQEIWRHALDGAGSIVPPHEMSGLIDEDSYGWAWNATPKVFQIVMFKGEPNQLVVNTLDPEDGASLGEVVIPMEWLAGDFYSTPSIVGWQDKMLWLAISSRIVVIDVAAGEVLYEWQ
jgi:outer membrane protein assembly factor BamB